MQNVFLIVSGFIVFMSLRNIVVNIVKLLMYEMEKST